MKSKRLVLLVLGIAALSGHNGIFGSQKVDDSSKEHVADDVREESLRLLNGLSGQMDKADTIENLQMLRDAANFMLEQKKDQLEKYDYKYFVREFSDTYDKQLHKLEVRDSTDFEGDELSKKIGSLIVALNRTGVKEKIDETSRILKVLLKSLKEIDADKFAKFKKIIKSTLSDANRREKAIQKVLQPFTIIFEQIDEAKTKDALYDLHKRGKEELEKIMDHITYDAVQASDKKLKKVYVGNLSRIVENKIEALKYMGVQENIIKAFNTTKALLKKLKKVAPLRLKRYKLKLQSSLRRANREQKKVQNKLQPFMNLLEKISEAHTKDELNALHDHTKNELEKIKAYITRDARIKAHKDLSNMHESQKEKLNNPK